jgi:hypothetical protein
MIRVGFTGMTLKQSNDPPHGNSPKEKKDETGDM